MHKLMLVIMSLWLLVLLADNGIHDWMSRQRRKEVRKKFYERHPKSQSDAHAPKIETMKAATAGS
jgi:hypothetical protein